MFHKISIWNLPFNVKHALLIFLRNRMNANWKTRLKLNDLFFMHHCKLLLLAKWTELKHILLGLVQSHPSPHNNSATKRQPTWQRSYITALLRIRTQSDEIASTGLTLKDTNGLPYIYQAGRGLASTQQQQ